VYARQVGDQKLTLGVSGMLWNRSLVMYDKETESLWSHLLGEAKQGPLKGKKLEQVPAVLTDWQTWSKQHPKGSVVLLSRTSKEYRREFYRAPEQFVLGIAADGKAKAWGFGELSKAPALNEEWDKQSVLVVFDKASVTARLYGRKLGDQVLTFQMAEGKLTDKETGSTWEPVTGQALAGPLAGKYLAALPAVVSYRQAWLQFHPRSEMVPPR
jgi:hypothetical protein